MSEQFMDKSTLLGVLPNAGVPVEEVTDSQEQVDADTSTESDDSGQDQDGVDASVDESQDTDDTGESTEDEGSAEGDSVDWKEKYEANEVERRTWQSKAMSSDADLGKALDVLRGSIDGSNGNQAEPAKPVGSTVMEKLSKMDGEEVVDVNTMQGLFTDFIAEQQADRNQTQQRTQMDDFNAKMTAELRAQPDLQEVTEYHKQHLTNDPQTPYLTDLGLYNRAKMKMLEAKNTEAFKQGETEGAKKAKGRQKRLEKLPGQPGTQGERVSVEDDPSGMLNMMLTRRKARGIHADGRIR